MKVIYKLCMIGMIYLLSNTTYAQIKQYSDDGTQSFIDPEAKTGVANDCICYFEHDYDRFNTVINLIEERDKAEWLRNQENNLKLELENRFGKTFPDFREAQKEFFKHYAAKSRAQEIFASLQNEINNQQQATTREKDINHYKVSIIGTLIANGATTAYGDLKMNGVFLRNIATAPQEVKNDMLNALNRDKANIAQRLTGGTTVLSGIDRANQNGQLENHIINDFINHYNSFDVENRIRLMTKYMIWQNTGQVLGNFLDPQAQSFPPAIYNSFAFNYRDVAYNIARQLGTPATVTYPQVTLEQALARHALNELGENEYNFAIGKPQVLGAIQDYFQIYAYAQAQMDVLNNLLEANINGTRFPAQPGYFMHNRAYPPGHVTELFETNYNGAGGKIRDWHFTSTAFTNGMNGFFQIIEALQQNSGGFHPETKGGLLRDALTQLGYQPEWTSYTNTDLANLFDFDHFTFGTDYHYAGVHFTAGIYDVLSSNGITSAREFLRSDIALDGARAYVSGNIATAEHLFRVSNLSQRLALTSELNQWLLDNPTQATLVNNHLIQNEFSGHSQTEATLHIASGASASPWQTTSGTIDGNDNFKYDATRTWTYPDGQQVTEFRLLNGDRIARGDYANCRYCSESWQRTMYLPIEGLDGTGMQWYDIVVPAAISTSANPFDFVINEFWDGAKWTGRYIVPLEDVIIVLGGQDLDGNEANRYLAGGMLVIGLIPGGKLLKPVAKVVKGTQAWRLVVKAGDKTVTLTYKIVNGFVDFGSRSKLGEIIIKAAGEEAHHIIPWALRNNNVVQEAAYAGFHMNNIINGRALKKFSTLTPDGIHGNHPKYNDYVLKRINEFKQQLPDWDAEDAAKFLEETLIPELNKHIDDAIKTGERLNEYFRGLL